MVKFSLSPDARVTAHQQGDEGQTVLVIDNALADPHPILRAASAETFRPIGPFFPGVRAPTPPDFNQSLCEAVHPLISAAFGVDAGRLAGSSFFSLVTTPPAELAPIQRIPHHDGDEPNLFATLLYLADPPQGGTAFFRHRSTGFETVTATRFPAYQQRLEADAREHGLPPARYATDGAPLFERIAAHEGLFNRMLIYRGITLHSGIINNQAPPPADLVSGRLTINGFFEI